VHLCLLFWHPLGMRANASKSGLPNVVRSCVEVEGIEPSARSFAGLQPSNYPQLSPRFGGGFAFNGLRSRVEFGRQQGTIAT